MSSSSILGGKSAAIRAAGHGADALGPSDSSDSGSDVQGERVMPTDADNAGELGAMPLDLDSDSDSTGTGERGSATGGAERDGADIRPDRIVDDGTVERNGPIDRDLSDIVDDIADDEADDDADDDAPTPSAAAGAADGLPHGRVFKLPAGTLEADGGR